LGAEVLHHTRLADKHGDAARDEECRNEAEKHMLSRIVLRHQQCFIDRPPHRFILEGNEIERGKDGHYVKEDFELSHKLSSPVKPIIWSFRQV
jgi:hypothetical protein